METLESAKQEIKEFYAGLPTIMMPERSASKKFKCYELNREDWYKLIALRQKYERLKIDKTCL